MATLRHSQGDAPTLSVSPEAEGRNEGRVSGDWTINNWLQLKRLQQRAGVPPIDVVHGSGLQSLDTVGAMAILSLAAPGSKLTLRGFNPEHQKLFDMVAAKLKGLELAPHHLPRRGLFYFAGRSIIQFWEALLGILSFFGRAVAACAELLTAPKKFRWREFFVQLEMVCVDAIGIVALVSLLIGTVVAYLFASQMERYGAALFVVDTVAITMCRELAPMIAAVIMAGRSGSAFTAQIGTMKMNEEIDALSVMGLSPLQVLVLPRVLALMVALPLLVFIGDLVGILGGFFVAHGYLGITGATFFQRLNEVLTMNSFGVGFIKAPVFALVIGIIGCRMGFVTEPNARSVGLSTTSTVVQSIVAVIILDAIFAVWFVEMGI